MRFLAALVQSACFATLLISQTHLCFANDAAASGRPPNIVFILTDDHRWDCYGASEQNVVQTPHLDRIADRGTRFQNAFVTSAICSPSRAACLTGRYGSANGVTAVGKVGLDADERTFADALGDAGYLTGVTGKWHLKTSPQECGFDFASTCWSNGTWYDRSFTIDGQNKTMPGFVDDGAVLGELYDLQSDAVEQTNLAKDRSNQSIVREFTTQLHEQQTLVSEQQAVAPAISVTDNSDPTSQPSIPSDPPPTPRTDLFISGVYPHFTVYGVYSQNGAHYKGGHNECGIGAIVPWAGKLWMVNYAPHMPGGSDHKLFSIDPDLSKPITVHPESVGGTPAGRMIHAESKQLLIGHHLIDQNGKVRTISPKDMRIRVTAIARHLKDPDNLVYYVDMEGSIWEANVHTLAVKRLFKKPVPGWHGKGGYTSQGRLVVSNNGELHVGGYDDLLVGGEAKDDEERGVLAEYDGKDWKIIERRQFTEITGPQGITGGSDGDDPIWTMGWDRRTVRLKVLDAGKWSTYLLPKAALCNDAYHGWYTEWPRIREITEGRWMMDMHGMFFDFPPTFSSRDTAGLRPIGSHLRYVPDFCDWNGKLVLASDETSIQGNPLAGQPQTNLWLGDYQDLKNWGPANGYGGPWVGDKINANTPSDPFLVAGFDRRVLHLATGQSVVSAQKVMRTTDDMPIVHLPSPLSKLATVTVPRGNWKQPAAGFSFHVDQSVTVFMTVDQRGKPQLGDSWKRTDLGLTWQHGGKKHVDAIYRQDFPAGKIEIPANSTEHAPGSFGMPHAAFVSCEQDNLQIQPSASASVSLPAAKNQAGKNAAPVVFTIEVDIEGNGDWSKYREIEVLTDRYHCELLPNDFDATWIRFTTNRDCLATAVMHQTAATYTDSRLGEELFAGLAEADASDAQHALIYAAKRNRNLRIIADEDRFMEFSKAKFEFSVDKPDEELAELLKVEPEFTVDDASVILKHNGIALRLPKGNAAFDQPFTSGSSSKHWPRDLREVESERHLANIHGTFYEVPLLINGEPPAFNLMRPVASHNKQISDFCTWNGLLVLTGIRPDAQADGHVFQDPTTKTSLWFGGIDDLWKFGKPVGVGGPWKATPVAADVPSDPYLMTGYDSKTLTLSSDVDTTINIEVDVDHQTGFHLYREIDVPAGKHVTHEFPAAFSAHWVRFRSRAAATVTAQLVYR